MTNRVLVAVSVLGVAAALLAPSGVEAQCRPDDIFCAELRIGPAQQPPPPPPVVVQPPPPPVVVQPPPQPPVVIVQPQQPPPPRVVYVQPPPQRQPQVVAVQLERRRVTRTQLVPDFDLGLHVNLGGLFMESASLGGASAAFRLRPIPHIGLDIGAGVYGGESYYYEGQGGERWEVPVTANVLFYFNPMHRFQVYAVLGVGMSFASQSFALDRTREFTYVGGEAGLGFEWRLGRRFALNVDVRAFIREQVADGAPEFSRVNADGSVQTTNTSGGGYGTVGMTWYFGG
jgi:hypothetical protein